MKKPLWTTAMIAGATQGTCSGDWPVQDISIDSRNIKVGDLFVALKGPSFDGHDFVADALANGAAGALVHQTIPGAAPEKLLLVRDTLAALQALGAAGRARSQAKIIAVTGSVGKTGCKEALRQIFAAQAPSFAAQGSFNNHWGVPLSLSRLPQDAHYGVFELGMNHMGELEPLTKAVQPHIALITAIAAVHIGNFNSLDEIAEAKSEIFAGIVKDGSAVIPADSSYSPYLRGRATHFGVGHCYSFGHHAKADARIESFTLDANSSVVKVRILGKSIEYTVGVPGEHWVMNSLSALLCAALAGADLEKAAAVLATLSLADGRGVPKRISIPDGSFTLIDESYNASPIAVEMAIKVLSRKEPSGNGRRLLALGDMRELGEHAKAMHLALAQPILDAKIDKVYCCGELMKHLYDALPEAKRGAYAFTSNDLAPIVASDIRNGDIITVKGSHSMEMPYVIKTLEQRSEET